MTIARKMQILMTLTLLMPTGRVVWAQNSSLYARDLPASTAPVTVQTGSWTYLEVPPPREIRIHDIVTIRVDISARMLSEGETQRRKNATYNAQLTDWVMLDGLKSVKPSPQADGDPTIAGALTQLFRAEGEIETSESLKFDIAAKVVDIRPNGNLILEAHRSIVNNDEVWEQSLTGTCRVDDIAPGNIILSRDIADLNISKRERGHVRDGYRRGWFLRVFDLLHPF